MGGGLTTWWDACINLSFSFLDFDIRRMRIAEGRKEFHPWANYQIIVYFPPERLAFRSDRSAWMSL